MRYTILPINNYKEYTIEFTQEYQGKKVILICVGSNTYKFLDDEVLNYESSSGFSFEVIEEINRCRLNFYENIDAKNKPIKENIDYKKFCSNFPFEVFKTINRFREESYRAIDNENEAMKVIIKNDFGTNRCNCLDLINSRYKEPIQDDVIIDIYNNEHIDVVNEIIEYWHQECLKHECYIKFNYQKIFDKMEWR